MHGIRLGRAGLALLVLLIGGCAAQQQTTGLTLGSVQRSLHKGMTQPEVTDALGAPNIVSKDDKGREVWTYDRVTKQSASRWFMFWQSGESSQQTLTLIITFDSEEADASGNPIRRVADFTYHATQF